MPDQASVYWILRHEQRLLLRIADPLTPFPQLAASLPLTTKAPPLKIGEWLGRPCYAAELRDFPEQLELEPLPLRTLFAHAGPEAFALAGRGVQLLDWQAQHRFCGRCATPAEALTGEFAMRCPACGLVAYPRLSPAIMVLVRDGERLLLARSPHFKPGVYSALAGFVEPGETLEQCAVREVREEVGIEITNLRYFASQPWPFPNSLMIAFFADYLSGEVRPAPDEIEAADWFTVDRLPLLPEPVSISRRLIEAACTRSA
ncbi:NAD(+) diphosphatase [Dechloromonas sp. ZY10]|uniref:NAD(+) diphosphatase n=1 Tax=Dechloromonas aquae TaxID=2664436 RepID=UPI00352916B7